MRLQASENGDGSPTIYVRDDNCFGWEEFVPFLAFPIELRTIVYTTNAVESINARFRKAVRHRTHFPNEQAALKVLYLVAIEKKDGRSNLVRNTNGWKPILNTLTIHYGDRIADLNNQ